MMMRQQQQQQQQQKKKSKTKTVVVALTASPLLFFFSMRACVSFVFFILTIYTTSTFASHVTFAYSILVYVFLC